MEKLVERAGKAEAEIEKLYAEFERLQKLQPEEGATPEELVRLRAENVKLNYRLGILKRAVEKEESAKPRKPAASSKKKAMEKPDYTGKMKSIHGMLVAEFRSALERAFPDLPEAPCPVTRSSKQGDYQFNGAMAIAGILKGQGIKMSPRDIATKILENMPAGSEVIERVECAGPGFVNIFVRKSFIEKELGDILKEGVRPPFVEGMKKRKRAILDYSSPNIAKEMHVGHLRSTIIGDSIANLVEFLGYDVLRLNHVGDWGTQFGMLIAHLKDNFPDYATKSPPIGDLQAFYKESKKRFDDDADFKARAYAAVVKLQSGQKDHIAAWKLICDVSRKEFQKVYERLNIKGLEERGESYYQDRMDAVVKLLNEKGLLEEDEGRKVMFGPGCEIPMTVIKSDGGYTYDTSDLATIRNRLHEENGDWLIYVTDMGQSLHFQCLFACAKKAGIWKESARVDHVPFGVVLGEDRKKFKTRSGDTVRLVDLLDEGLKRAKEKLADKEKDKPKDKQLTAEEVAAAQRSVAYGCIKYADLSHNRNQEYVFSFDKMLEDKGNTAVYMLYAYTRISSISRKANLSSEAIAEARRTTPVALEHDKELKLGKLLLRFPEVILKVADDLCLHTLCEFMYEVATTFTEFYDACYCVEKNAAGDVVKVNMGRIMLCDATAQVLEKCFRILGLEPVTKM